MDKQEEIINFQGFFVSLVWTSLSRADTRDEFLETKDEEDEREENRMPVTDKFLESVLAQRLHVNLPASDSFSCDVIFIWQRI